MDWQTGFNVAFGIAGMFGGWLLRIVWDLQKGLRADLQTLQQSLPENYARRDDFKDMIRTLFAKLDRIEEKLDGKVDKGTR